MGGKPITPPPHAHAFATAGASATSAANTGTSVVNALTSGLRRRRKSQHPPRDSDTVKSDSGTDDAKLPPGNGTSSPSPPFVSTQSVTLRINGYSFAFLTPHMHYRLFLLHTPYLSSPAHPPLTTYYSFTFTH